MRLYFDENGKVTPIHDEVKIVRCKDCKYGEPKKNARGEQMVECNGEFPDWLRDPNWFCADGERESD